MVLFQYTSSYFSYFINKVFVFWPVIELKTRFLDLLTIAAVAVLIMLSGYGSTKVLAYKDL